MDFHEKKCRKDEALESSATAHSVWNTRNEHWMLNATLMIAFKFKRACLERSQMFELQTDELV